MNKEEFLEYIIDFASCIHWIDLKSGEQLKALFTSYCFIYGIDADTKECDDVLNTIYGKVMMEPNITYDDFGQFMIELIV